MKKEKKPIKPEKTNHDADDFFNDFWSIRGNRFGFFDDFEEQIRRMEQRMNQLYNRTIQGDISNNPNQNMQIYGWTYRVGPDGQPHFQEFGNLPHMIEGSHPQITAEREPLIDVQEADKEIYITIELPGVNKKDINLETTENTIIIEVNNEKHPYYKEVSLPSEINENKTDATYNNGVLSITLEKIKQKKKGKKINIK